jgi:hypothetical protein
MDLCIEFKINGSVIYRYETPTKDYTPFVIKEKYVHSVWRALRGREAGECECGEEDEEEEEEEAEEKETHDEEHQESDGTSTMNNYCPTSAQCEQVHELLRRFLKWAVSSVAAVSDGPHYTPDIHVKDNGEIDASS